MVISEIRALYNDENDLLRTVIKRIYEEWDPERKQWHLSRSFQCRLISRSVK
jgi:hypothetical protein